MNRFNLQRFAEGEKVRATGSTPFGTSLNHDPISPFQKTLNKYK